MVAMVTKAMRMYFFVRRIYEVFLKEGSLPRDSGDTPTGHERRSPISDSAITMANNIYKNSYDPNCGNALEIKGDTVDKVAEALSKVFADSGYNELAEMYDVIDGLVVEFFTKTRDNDFKHSRHFREYIQIRCMEVQGVKEADFSLFRVLGRGGFGMVNGCKRCCTGKLYAMKVLNKKRIKMKNAEELCINERNILARVESRFVVTLKYAFQTQHDLFLILDLMTGGDLAFHLNRARGNLPVDRAKFYAAQVLLGVSHLHEAGFVYRDLKPENVLLDNEGNCRISDLGLACSLSPKLSGRCGTRGYWAPEMLAKDAGGHRLYYDQAVDWWSFGCLVYEMLYGKCPFRTTKAKNLNPSDKQKSMDQATLEMTPDYMPEKFTPDAVVVCQGLLTRDPKKRLGSGEGRAREIMKQAWFSTVCWAQIELGKIKVKSYAFCSLFYKKYK
jgi:beta-adrenergic-receptor kinase